MNNVFYMYSNDSSSSQILIFLIIIVALMLVCILVINMITKKRNEKYNRMFHPVDKYSDYSKSKKIVKTEKPVIELNNNIKEDKKDEEIEEILEEPEVIEIITDDSSIDKISNLLEDNINNPKPIDLTKFEEEEEKNAIISYDELVKRAGSKKIVYKVESEKEQIEELSINDEKSNVKTKFKASKVISPIYGVQKEEKKEEEFIDINNGMREYDDEELQKDITFLTNLKTFRSNLD